MVLPQEDAGEFAALEAALVAELAPVGALQTVLARRIAVAAWRLARADRIEAEVLEFRSYEGANAGMALIRDGNGTRAIETLLRYRGAAMAEFWRALRTLKALQAEQAVATGPAPEVRPERLAARPPLAHRPQPNQPEGAAERPPAYALPKPPAPGRTLHEPAALWLPQEPETGRARHEPAPPFRTNPKPQRSATPPEAGESCSSPRPGGNRANQNPTGIAAR